MESATLVELFLGRTLYYIDKSVITCPVVDQSGIDVRSWCH